MIILVALWVELERWLLAKKHKLWNSNIRKRDILFHDKWLMHVIVYYNPWDYCHYRTG